MTNLPFAHGLPPCSGLIKQYPEDFIVEEVLGFEPTGEGEHIFLKIQKIGENTDYLARQIAKYAGLPRMAVNYAGMKDRNALTVQWFGVHLPGKREIDWAGLESDSVKVLQVIRHNRKLKTGALKGNRFILIIRELKGDIAQLESRFKKIADEGVPNYFGPQRFGKNGENLNQALNLFRGELKLRDRKLEGIYLSAARSEIFNQVLAGRVEDKTWNQALPGDVFMFEGSHSIFQAELTVETLARVAAKAIHPSGPLWGLGELASSGAARDLELAVAAEYSEFCAGLERAKMEAARRQLRLMVTDLGHEFPSSDCLRLSFSLPAGAYATVVLRELVDFEGVLDG